MSEQSQPAFDPAFWFKWIMATTVGWLLGSLLLPSLSTVAAGVGAGVMQCLVLYRRLPQVWRWALATALAWIGGWVLLLTLVPSDLRFLLTGLIVGLCTGLAQWSLLRREVRWAGWWIAIGALAWITGLTLLPGILSTGALAGATSGLALSLLLHNPKHAGHPAPAGEQP